MKIPNLNTASASQIEVLNDKIMLNHEYDDFMDWIYQQAGGFHADNLYIRVCLRIMAGYADD